VKERRQRAILELVRGAPVQTQQELARALAERGFRATQATVSRDIQELGLIRTGAGYQDAAAIASQLVLSIRQVEFLAVVRTTPGSANLVARAVDEAELEEVVGTVAGDDTILVVLADPAAGERLRRFLGAGA
jgi:transcriptional regulator of arginine metabolism